MRHILRISKNTRSKGIVSIFRLVCAQEYRTVQKATQVR